MLHFSVLERATFNAKMTLSLLFRFTSFEEAAETTKTPKSGLSEQLVFTMVNGELEASYCSV